MNAEVRRLDCRQLKCPMPIVQLAMALRDLEVGEEILVEATDPAFLADVRAWSRMTGHPLDDELDGEVKQVRVRKAVTS
ncbi:MAG: sulfurtransferase TusA family protein [Planctomycetota bacterium]